MNTELAKPERLTQKEWNVIEWAFNLANSIIVGDYHLPGNMCYSINQLQDAVWDLAEERGMSMDGTTDGNGEKTTRQRANEQILGRIREAVAMFPDWRFHQILQNIGVELPEIDQWYEESEDTLKNTNINCKD